MSDTLHSTWIQFKWSDKGFKIIGTCEVCGRSCVRYYDCDVMDLSDIIANVLYLMDKKPCPITNPDFLVVP